MNLKLVLCLLAIWCGLAVAKSTKASTDILEDQEPLTIYLKSASSVKDDDSTDIKELATPLSVGRQMGYPFAPFPYPYYPSFYSPYFPAPVQPSSGYDEEEDVDLRGDEVPIVAWPSNTGPPIPVTSTKPHPGYPHYPPYYPYPYPHPNPKPPHSNPPSKPPKQDPPKRDDFTFCKQVLPGSYYLCVKNN